MIISLVAAADEQNVIGYKNALPWKLPADMKFFKNLTTGHPVIMGRRTFESMECKPLKNRTNVIITRNPTATYGADVKVFANIGESVNAFRAESEIFIIGGAQIFREAMPIAEKIYLTRIHSSFLGDSYFPEIIENEWIEAERSNHYPDKDNKYPYSFIKLVRK